MDPKISNLDEKNGVMSMTITGFQHTLLNSLRRVIVADIPTFVFRTFPHNENKVRIEINTTRHNNEILKQRFGCIPIHIDDLEFPYEDYQIEADKKNDSDTIQMLTTQDFKVFNKNTNQYLTETSARKFFPPNQITGDYIVIARLMPKLSDNLLGEHVKFEADISVSTANQDGMYNVVSTCSFGATVDAIKAGSAWTVRKKELVASKMTKDELEFEEKNWRLLEAKRHVVEHSHEFMLESVGVYENMRLMDLGCIILIEKFKAFVENINKNVKIKIEPNINSTVPNEYLITLFDEDYTLANPLIYYIYQTHFLGDKRITFCGFRKPHPHNNIGEIRLAFTEPVDASAVAGYLIHAALKCTEMYTKVQNNFSKID